MILNVTLMAAKMLLIFNVKNVSQYYWTIKNVFFRGWLRTIHSSTHFHCNGTLFPGGVPMALLQNLPSSGKKQELMALQHSLALSEPMQTSSVSPFNSTAHSYVRLWTSKCIYRTAFCRHHMPSRRQLPPARNFPCSDRLCQTVTASISTHQST